MKENDLNYADVLLCKGRGFMSDFIAAIDGGKYSHAIFYIGNGQVAHSVGCQSRDTDLHDRLKNEI